MKQFFLALSVLFIFSCSTDSEDDNSVCECQTIDFRYVINRDQNQYGEFTGQHCLSYWKNPDFFNLDIDESTYPPTITGVTEAIFEATKERLPCD